MILRLKGNGWAHLITSAAGTYAAQWNQSPAGTYASSTAAFKAAGNVTLTSNNPSLTLPASVMVPVGASTATFSATAAATIASNQSATVTAILGSSSQPATISLLAPVLVSGVTCSPASLGQGAVSNCTVTMTQVSPAGGSSVTLASNNALLAVPAMVTVAAGATTATFIATAAASIVSNQTATVTASLGSSLQTATISLLAPVLVSTLACSPSSLGPSAASMCTITMTQASPAGGFSVTLASNNALLIVPATVTIAAGATTATFTTTAAASIASNQTATVTASMGSSLQTAAVGLLAPVLVSGVACSPASLGQSAASTCTVTTTQTAPAGGSSVTLASNNALLTVTPSATVPAGATTATFIATAAASITSNQSATVTASLAGSSQTVIVSLWAPVMVSALACNPNSLGQTAVSTCTLILTQPAPAGGIAIPLSSNNPLLTVPPTTTVTAGATSSTFNATVAATIPGNQSATITAALNGESIAATISLAFPTWPNGYNYQATFTVAAGQVPSAQTNFPVLISGTFADFATTANGGRISNTCTQTVGNNATTVPCDLIFTSDPAGTRLLNWEFETYAATSGAANIWVNAPTLANGTVIYAWYGQPSVTTLQTTPSATWSSSFMAVYHLKENPAGTAPQMNDSTPNGNNATMSGSVSATEQQPGEIGGSINFEGNTWAGLANPANFSFERTDSFSISGWFNVLSNSAGTLSSKYPNLGAGWALLQFPGSSRPSFSLGLFGTGSSTFALVETPAVTMGAWHYVVATYSGTGTVAGMNIYVDGVNQALTTLGNNLSTSILNTVTPAINGRAGPTQMSTDSMDELRISTKGVVLSPAWVTASYNNESHPGIFLTAVTGVSNMNAGALSPAPSSTSFLSQTVNTTSASQAIAVTNDGPGPATIGSIAITGTNQGDFAQTNNCPISPATLAVSAFCTINVTFTPQAANLRSAAVSITATGNSPSVGLSGAGAIAPSSNAGSESLSALPSSMTFPNHALNTRAPLTGKSVTATAISLPPVSSLQCSPKAITAGSAVTCELLVSASPQSAQVELESSSEQVLIPSVVTTRPNQSSLTFQARTSPVSKQEQVTITATSGTVSAEDTILVIGASGPILRVPKKQVARAGESISFTVTATDPSGLPLHVDGAGIPAGASFDPPTGVFEWSPQASQAGRHRIAFTATNSARQAAAASIEIDVDSGLPVLNGPALSCSPASIATMTGKWLGAPGSQLSDPTGALFELGGTSVNVNGQAVPILYSSEDRVDFLCPETETETGTGTGTQLPVVVASRFGSSQPVMIGVQEAVPSILSLDDSQQNQGLISFHGMNDLVMERNFSVPSHPAQPGDRIVIFATGLGSAADSSSGTMLVRLGDVYVGVESVQAVPGHAGVYGIQVRVPAAMTFGAAPVQLQMTMPDGHQIYSNIVTGTFEAVRQ